MPSISAVSEPRTYTATYYDGRTAQRQSVTVCLRAGALDVVGEDGGVLDQWLYGEVELSDQGSGGTRVIKRGTEARLVIADARTFAELKARAPNLESQRSRTLRNMGLSLAVTVVVIVAGYFSLPLLSGIIVEMIPVETEARIGDTYADEVASFFASERNGALCGSGPGRAALSAVVNRLSQHTSGPFVYRVDILDTPLANAVALPGGRIFLFRGVLDKADSFDEVAGVLAHEMQHVNLRHGMQGLVRSYGVNILADMMFGGNMMGDVSRIMMMTSYSRDAELAADKGAIATLRSAGISTRGMARFFERLKKEDERGLFDLPALLSTHPPSEAREALARDVAELQFRGWSLSDAQWTALKSICE